MNKINSFYYGLRHLSQDVENNMSLQSKMTQDGNAYLLVPLRDAVGQCIVIQGVSYEILHHHVSIYADYQPFARHSDTHYTAYLKTSAGEEGYVLHVYFDAKDQCINRPSFVKISHAKSSHRHAAKKTKEVVSALLCDEADDHLLSGMAVALSTSVLSSLRKWYQAHVYTVQTSVMTFLETYRLLEARADIESCLTELDLLLDLSLSLQDPTYQKCLAAYKETLSWKQAELLNPARVELNVQGVIVAQDTPAPRDASSAKKASVTPSTKSKKTSATPKKKSHVMQACMTKMEASKVRYFDTLQRETLTMKPYPALGALEEYYHALQDVDVLYSQSALSQDVMHSVWQQLLLIQKQGVIYFEKALRCQDVRIIERLKGYATFLSDEILIDVLKSGDAKALDLLLQQGAFPINRIVWMDEKGQPTNLLEYAFHHQLTDCFECLLQHNASLLTTMMSPWPLADRLFQADEDPCSVRFKACYVGKKRQALLQALCATLRAPDVEQTAEVITRLQDYERMMFSLRQLPGRSFPASSSSAAIAVEEDQRTIRQETKYLDVPSLIRSSLRLQELESEINRLYAQYFKLLSRTAQEKERKERAQQTHLLANIMPSAPKESISRDELHDKIEEHLLNTLEYYSLKIERINLEKTYKEQSARLKTGDPLLVRLAEVRAMLTAAESNVEKMKAFDSLRGTMVDTVSALKSFIPEDALPPGMQYLLQDPNRLFHNPWETGQLGLEMIKKGLAMLQETPASLPPQECDAAVECDGLRLTK